MIEVENNGQLYKLPNGLTDFQKEMYIHLINWKWKNVTKQVGTYKKKDRKGIMQTYEYDAILPVEVHKEFPIVFPTILEDLKRHQEIYSFKFHEHFNHMASSQAANINLFLPILLHEHRDKVLLQLKPDYDHLAVDKLYKGFRIEFWDGNSNKEKGILGDHSPIAGTDSDIAIAYYNQHDELCLWLIEHKLTEKEFTECGGAKSRGRTKMHNCKKTFNEILDDKNLCYYHSGSKYQYWNTTEANKTFFVNQHKYDTCPFRGGMNQLWRNQLLGFALEKSAKYKHVYFSVVKHPDNRALDTSIAKYKDLIDYNSKFSVFDSRAVVESVRSINEDDLNKWVDWYEDLYRV
jgi:hypothetical protein